MPSNYTENYQLSQWERTDKVLMEDFNSDNAKLDAALKAEAGARASGDAALQAALAQKGNVRAEYYTYTGTGTYGKTNPCHIPFTRGEAVLVIVFGGQVGDMTLHKGLYQTVIRTTTVDVNWTASGVSWYGSSAENQLNYKGSTYTALIFYKLD